MGWIISIIILVILVLLLLIVAIIDLVSHNIIVKIITRFSEKHDNDEDYKKYLEKKQRQIEQHRENIRESQNTQTIHYTETKVIEIQQPIGKWTKLVTMTQLQYINNVKKFMGDKFSNKLGFWQMKVRAKAASQGREKGRGR